MTKEEIKPLLKQLLIKLTDLNFDSIYEHDKLKILTVEELRNAIVDYPGEIFNSTHDLWLDFYLYGNENDDENLVEYDLWYDGVKSDNTLSVTFYKTGEYSIEDIHVL